MSRAADRVSRLGLDPERHLEDGKDMGWWVRLYFDYTSWVMGSPVREGWPGGLPVDEQPNLLVEMFDAIESGILRGMKLDGKR